MSAAVSVTNRQLPMENMLLSSFFVFVFFFSNKQTSDKITLNAHRLKGYKLNY